MKKFLLTTMLLCLIGQVIFSQNQTTVTGKVTNDKNEPLQNATVKLKNGKETTMTNADGKFSIKVASFPAVLLITSSEYDDKEISVTNNDEVTIIMSVNEKNTCRSNNWSNRRFKIKREIGQAAHIYGVAQSKRFQ